MSEKKNVLISGSSRGLGREISEILKTLNFNVITMGFSSPTNVDIRCNLLDKETLSQQIHKFSKKFGKIDVLICNAGTGKIPEQNLDSDALDCYFHERNYLTSECLLDAAEPFLRSPGALVVGISSIAALIEDSGAPLGYSKAKRKMNNLFLERARTLAAKEIRVNLISPGNIFFKGSRWEEIRQEFPETVEIILREKVPLHNFISPVKIVDAILFLASKSARNITGNNLVIDGGQIL